MNTTQKLLEKIQAEKIIPIPKWHFVLKNMFFWSIGIFCILLGVVAVSIVLDSVFSTETEILKGIMHSHIDFILSLVPFFWIFFAFLFLGFSYLGMSHTKKAYKYSPLTIWGASMLISITLGTGVYLSGYAEKIEHLIAKNIAFYHGNEERRKAHWNHPEKGFISGEIQEIFLKKKELILRDWKQNFWKISYKNAEIKFPPHLRNNKTVIEKKLLKKGQKIKIQGKISGTSPQAFEAETIRGWGRGEGFQKKR